ncbi:hypothetical protein [Catenovulum sediminis]|uniref:TIGR03016 family PEP-CTERM system-associated outer membrane protein n=1 Tax=Catenovulum sediminis TaxID=1740262 RepID=A0ABV1RG53_9ALTE
MHTRTRIINNKFCSVASAVICALSGTVNASDVKLIPMMEVGVYNINYTTPNTNDLVLESDGSVDDRVIQYKPSLAIDYKSKKLNVSSFVDYAATQHSNRGAQDTEHLSYSINSDLAIYEQALHWRGSVNRKYRVADSQLGAFSDEIVGSENLTGVMTMQQSLDFLLPNTRYINASAKLSLNKSEAQDDVELDEDVSNFSTSTFDTESKNLNLAFANGDRSAVDWVILMSHSKSDRAELSDYSASNFVFELGVPITQRFSWVADASINKNKIDNDQALSSGLTHKQWGTGLSWRFIRNSHLSILAYRSKTGEQEAREFIGGEFEWVMSSRSQLKLTADRNQFGENYGFNLNLRNRNLQASASYSEGIDINSQQSFSTGQLGSFVCPLGSATIDQCFLPQTLDYQLQAGEQWVTFNGRDIQLNDEVVNFKSGSFNLSYDNGRKLKLFAGYRLSEQESVEKQSSNNDRLSSSVSASVNYKVSAKSDLSLTTSISKNTYLGYQTVTAENPNGDRIDKNRSWALSFKSQLSPRLSTDLSYSYRQTDSNQAGRDTEDNRLTLIGRYVF